jgi:HSP90 family molecular chaperone
LGIAFWANIPNRLSTALSMPNSPSPSPTQEYSTNLKLGVMEDPSNRTRLAKLLRFQTSASADKQSTLQEYVDRMKEKQQAIYYVAGTSRQVSWMPEINYSLNLLDI